MLKKFILGIMLAVCSVSFTVEAASWGSRSRVNQSTLKGAIEVFIRSLAEEDANLLWQLLPPEIQKACVNESGSVRAAQKLVYSEMLKSMNNPAAVEQIKACWKDLNLRQQMVSALMQESSFTKMFTRINGKWYFNIPELLAAGNAQSSNASARKIDQSSKKAVAAAFVKAVFMDQDINTVWQLLSNDIKANAIKEFGNEAKAKDALAKKFWGNVTPDQLKRMKETLSDKKQFNAIVDEAASAPAWKEIDGKWYINNL